jgi:hypothetical protein
MPIFNNILAGAAGQAGGAGADYTIERSLRFNSGDSAYLSEDFGSAGNRKTWTWSGWIKRSEFGNQGGIFSSYTGSHPSTFFRFNTDDTFQFEDRSSSASNFRLVSDAVFRDPSAWFHLVVSVDTTQATASDRVKIYINGEQVTSFSTENYPSQNLELDWNTATEHRIGRHSEYLDGYLAEIHCVDGQALAASDFGEYDDNGVWQPKAYTGTYNPQVDNSQDWSSSPYNSGNTADASYPATNAFSGSIGSTYTDGWLPAQNTTNTWTSDGNFSSATSVKIYYIATGGGVLTVNGSAVTTNNDGTVRSVIVDVTGTGFTGFTNNWIGSPNGPIAVLAVEVDGVRLVDTTVSSATSNSFHLDFSDNSSTTTVAEDSSGNNNHWTAYNLAVSDTSVASYASTYGSNITAAEAAKFFDSDDSDYGVATGDFVGYSYSAGNLVRLKVENTDSGSKSFYIQPRVNNTFVNQGQWIQQSAGTVGTNTWTVPGNTTATAVFTFPSGHDGNGRLYLAGNSSFLRLYSMKGVNNEIIDSLLDSPTNYDDGTNVGGNYATMNPLDKEGSFILENGNLECPTHTGAAWSLCRATHRMDSGKFYWEITIDSANHNLDIGVADGKASGLFTGGDYAYRLGYGSLTAGDVWGLAYDADGGTLDFYLDGVLQGIHSQTSVPSKLFPAISLYGTHLGVASAATFNFGQRSFAYTPPTGYKSLCTTNLPDPTIADGSTAFDVGLYTGTGSATALAVSGPENPDFVWIKGRSGASSHALYDVIRGFNLRLYSNTTGSEYDYGSDILAPTSTGFNLTTSDADHNSSSATYVAWQWVAGTSTVSNTDGTITSSVRANQTAGFSIVSYTGTGAAQTTGHGLNATPAFVILKNRDTGSTHWQVFGDGFERLQLSTTGAELTDGYTLARTSTTISPTGNSVTNNQMNANGDDYIAYCFAPVEGYSAFGSYTGNGSNDGSFVYTGFKVKYLLTKPSSAGGDWMIWDAEREPFNVNANTIQGNDPANEADTSGYKVDLLSNGFKFRMYGSSSNASGVTYVWAAFAEHPFKTARAR